MGKDYTDMGNVDDTLRAEMFVIYHFHLCQNLRIPFPMMLCFDLVIRMTLLTTSPCTQNSSEGAMRLSSYFQLGLHYRGVGRYFEVVNILQSVKCIPESLNFYMALENLGGGAVSPPPVRTPLYYDTTVLSRYISIRPT